MLASSAVSLSPSSLSHGLPCERLYSSTYRSRARRRCSKKPVPRRQPFWRRTSSRTRRSAKRHHARASPPSRPTGRGGAVGESAAAAQLSSSESGAPMTSLVTYSSSRTESRSWCSERRMPRAERRSSVEVRGAPCSSADSPRSVARTSADTGCIT